MGDTAAAEICVTKAHSSGTNRCLDQAPVGYVTQPKLDKRHRHFVSAQGWKCTARSCAAANTGSAMATGSGSFGKQRCLAGSQPSLPRIFRSNWRPPGRPTIASDSTRAPWTRFGHVWSTRPSREQELKRMCSAVGIPGDFDIAQISWRPDHDPLFYRQLSRRARRLYLFRGEYIFDLERPSSSRPRSWVMPPTYSQSRGVWRPSSPFTQRSRRTTLGVTATISARGWDS